MSEPTLGTGPAAPPPAADLSKAPPPAGPTAPSGGPGKVIAGLLALGALTVALCVGAVYWVRRAPVDAGQGAPEATASAAQAKTVRAVVTLPEGHTKAVMRQSPDFDAPIVIVLTAGTAVEITNTATTKSQTWCRVRTLNSKPPASGWMHSDVLRME